jgi:hypothetical protein
MDDDIVLRKKAALLTASRAGYYPLLVSDHHLRIRQSPGMPAMQMKSLRLDLTLR